MKAERAEIAAASRRLDPQIRLVLFHGADTAASHDHARVLARQFAGDDPLSPTVIAGAGLGTDPASLLAAASAVSMFGGAGLVQVEDVGEDALAAVSMLLGARTASNPVVMTAGLLKKGSKLLACVEGAAEALAFASYPPSERDTAALLEDLAAEYGLRANRAAIGLLAEAVGADRGVARREIEKIALYLDASPAAPVPLDGETVAAVGADFGDADVAALIDGIVGGRPEVADRLLACLRAGGTPASALIRGLAQRLRLLLELRLAVDGGSSPRTAVDALRPPIFWKDKPAIVGQLGRWRTPRLRQMLALLLAAELDLRQPGSAGEIAVDQLFLRLAAKAARSGR